MKKLLFISILLLSISCVGSPTITKEETLPIEVISLKESQNFDTVLYIKTEKKTYLFNQRQEYAGTYDNEIQDDFGVGIVLGVSLSVFIVIMIFI